MPQNIPRDKPRIVIYGTGQYGQHVTRFAVQKGWPIVAAFNRAGPKVGQDLGRLAGLGRDLGVVVQDCDTADFSQLDADIGVVTMTNLLRLNLPAYERLMNAGLNVICHGSESYFPQGNDEALAAQIDALAKKNGVSFCGSAIWDMSRIWSGLLAVGPCTELTSLRHTSITDAKGQALNKAQAQQVGCGLTLAQYDASGLRESRLAVSYKTIPEQVLFALGYTLAGARTTIEPVVFDVDVHSELMGGVVPAGHCVGTRILCDVDTEEGVSAHAQIELRLFQPGEVEHMFWEVNGLPRTRIRVERDNSAHATASNLFNRIRDVIAAPPGIVLVSQLGPMKPTLFG